jgi:hypothetical protein
MQIRTGDSFSRWTDRHNERLRLVQSCAQPVDDELEIVSRILVLILDAVRPRIGFAIRIPGHLHFNGACVDIEVQTPVAELLHGEDDVPFGGHDEPRRGYQPS